MNSKHSKKIILALLAVLTASCAEKKVDPIKDIGGPREQSIPYEIGPLNPSKIFIDKTESYGLKGVKAVHLYAVDFNADGATDLVALDDFYASPKFYSFDKKSKSFKISPDPFNEIVRASYLNFIDLDRDGILDVIVGNLNQKTEMTQHPGRVFQGVIEKGSLRYQLKSVLPSGIRPTASIVPLDFNLDGEMDLYLANWFTQNDNNPKPVTDHLLLGKGFLFTDVSGQLAGEHTYNKSDKVFTEATPTIGASICDVDKNGYPDILTNNSNGYFNKLWFNIDGENFVNYGVESNYSADNEGSKESKGGGNSFFSLCGDYNKDLLVDVVVGNLSKDIDPESRDKSAILTGTTMSFPPKFLRTEFVNTEIDGRWSEGNRRGVWIDYNLDGLNDLLIANSGFPPSSRLALLEQQADHAFEEKGLEFGINLMNPSGVVTIDLNGDGVMDFISGQSKVRAGDIDNRIYVFENQTAREGRGSIRFHLQGKKSNSQGISSTLILTTNKSKYLGEANYSFGTLPSQNEEGIYFSFNKETPKDVEVRWSIGNEDRLGRVIPKTKRYNLGKLKGKGRHLEVNLCEDGRLLLRNQKCY